MKKNRGFTPLEILKRLLINFWTEAKPAFGSVFSITKRLRKSLTGFTPLEIMGQKYSNKTNKPLTGFTLIEMLVVFSIIVILSMIVFADYKGGAEQYVLLRVSSQMAQDVRRIQAMAGLTETGCKKFGDNNDEFHSNYKYGYGINFKMSEDTGYLLFADCDGNEKYTGSDFPIGTRDIDIKLLAFETGAVIKDLKIDGSSTNKLSIVFSPPDPKVILKNGASGESGQIIVSSKNDITKTKTISINKVGLVDIN